MSVNNNFMVVHVMGVIYRGTCNFYDSLPYLAEKPLHMVGESLLHTL